MEGIRAYIWAMISYQPDASNPLNPANRDILPRYERITTYNCDWPGCSNDAHAPGALCDQCQAEADAAAPSDDQPINTPNTMNTPDNFDALWANLKDQVKQARTNREAIYTYDESAISQRFGGRLGFSGIDDDDDGRSSVIMHTGRGTWSGTLHMRRHDLLNLAAHCIALAEEMTDPEAQAVRPEPATAA